MYVSPIQGTNLSDKETEALRELVKIEVQKNSGFRVVDKLDEANFYLQTKIIKFNTYNITMTRWQKNNEISRAQVKANNPRDLEAQLGVAVKKVLSTENSPGEAVPFYTQEKNLGEKALEKKQRNINDRVPARRQILIGFGPAYFSKMNSAKSNLGITAGTSWTIDDNWDLGLASDFAISTESTDAYMFTGKIFGNYFFASNDISPFIGLGFGYGWSKAKKYNLNGDDSASGFAVSGQAGLKFFRTSTINLAVSGEYTQILDKNVLGNPGVFMLKVALLY